MLRNLLISIFLVSGLTFAFAPPALAPTSIIAWREATSGSNG